MTPRFQVAAASLVLFGCGELLGIPDDPHVSVPAVESMNGPEGPGVLVTMPAAPAAAVVTSSPPRQPESLPDLGMASPAAQGSTGGESLDAGIALVPSSETASSGPDAAPSVPGTPGSVVAGVACPPLVTGSISDFQFAPGGSTSAVTFGPEASFRGGTYFYPAGAGLSSDVTEGDWHLSGMVSGASGFGLYLSRCQLLDASPFAGLSFKVWGTVDAGASLRLLIETAAQQVSYVWLNGNKTVGTDPDVAPNAGRCTPAVLRYDGTCTGARVTLPVTETPTQIDLPWLDWTGGRPVASVDPKEITAIVWEFPVSAAGAYAVDVHIDDLRFTAP